MYPSHCLTSVDLLSLTCLKLTAITHLTDLSALRACTALHSLLSHNSPVTSLDPPRACTQLIELDLTYNQSLVDIDGIAACTALNSLIKRNCPWVSDAFMSGVFPFLTGLRLLVVSQSWSLLGLSFLASCLQRTSVISAGVNGWQTLVRWALFTS